MFLLFLAFLNESGSTRLLQGKVRGHSYEREASVVSVSRRTEQISEGLRGFNLTQPQPSDFQFMFRTYYIKIATCVGFIGAYIFAGSGIFMVLEGGTNAYSYLDCLYWAVVTANTVC